MPLLPAATTAKLEFCYLSEYVRLACCWEGPDGRIVVALGCCSKERPITRSTSKRWVVVLGGVASVVLGSTTEWIVTGILRTCPKRSIILRLHPKRTWVCVLLVIVLAPNILASTTTLDKVSGVFGRKINLSLLLKSDKNS